MALKHVFKDMDLVKDMATQTLVAAIFSSVSISGHLVAHY
jgi:hypothetical protein